MTSTYAPQTLITTRPLAVGDLGVTAAWQTAERLDGPSALGAGFVRRWQAAHLDSPHAVALVAERVEHGPSGGQPRVCGLLLAVTDRRAHQEHLVHRHGRLLARAGAAGSLRRPDVVGRWLRERSGPVVQAVTLLPTRGGAAAGARRAAAAAGGAGTGVVVDVVVVDPRVRGAGVGRQLAEALVERSAGAERVEVRVPWGSGSEGFFAACGWVASATRPGPRGALETPLHRDPVVRRDQRSSDPSSVHHSSRVGRPS